MERAQSSDNAKAKWSLLVCMAGDNNLDSAALKDIAEMAKVGSTKDVHALVQLGGGQIYQANLVNHLTPFDRNYQIAAHKAQAMHYKGFVSAIAGTAGDVTIYHLNARNIIPISPWKQRKY